MLKELILTLILLMVPSHPLVGAERSEPESSTSFSQLRNRQDRDNFTQTAAWLAANRNSPEYHDAAAWFLKTAFEKGWYAETLPLCEQLLKEARTSDSLANQARSLQIVGLAADSQTESALEKYREELKKVRIRAPNETLELTYALSAQCQISGDPAAAREVLRLTSSAFFLI